MIFNMIRLPSSPTRMIRPRSRAMLAGTVPPIGYMVKKHLDWSPTADDKKRMLIHQGLFLTVTAAGLVALHRIKRWRTSNLKKTLASIAATLPAVLAFEGGMKLARIIVPRPEKSEKPPLRYIPPQLRQNLPAGPQ